MVDLLNVDDAINRILSSIEQLPSESISIEKALHRVLAKDISANIDLPPFANSSMDGYAVRSADIAASSQENPTRLKVTQDIPAGRAPDFPINSGEAARIMTGAPMPPGADAVVPVEDTDSDWSKGDSPPLQDFVEIYRTVDPGAYVRPIGENVKHGEVVLHAGTILNAQDIGMLAALGNARIEVVRLPRIAIISTGDELVAVDEPLAPGKIRDTNSYTLAALIETYGAVPIRLPVAKDNLEAVRKLFKDALAQNPDMIISSAGVSVGTADLVRTVLDELGEVGFWRINLRPGKPLAFGNLQQIPFFGLPGNPVSAMVTFEVIVRPALLKMAGKPNTAHYETAIMNEDMQSDGRRSYIRVKLTREGNTLIATSTGTQSSGALMSMLLADGLLIIPEDVTFVKAGTPLQVRCLRHV